MELILKVFAGSVDPVDVVVDAEATHAVSELARALAVEVGVRDRSPVLTLTRTGRSLEPDSTVGESGIVSGDEIVVGFGRRVEPVPPAPDIAVSADILAGPDAGSSTTLLAGSYSIGRQEGCDIVLGDPTVSRIHADVEVAADWTVSVVPRSDVANPVTVNDVVVDVPTVVVDDDVVGLGGTRIALRSFVRADGERTDQLGQIEFQRTPYRPPIVIERAAPKLGKVPERREGRKFQLLSALAPLAGGLTMYAFTQRPQFLIMTLLSPLIALANSIEDRRTGRKKFVQESADFEVYLIGWRARIDAALALERIERLRSAPDLADLSRRATLRTVQLWARGRAAPDFLRLRVGLGRATPFIEPDVGEQGDDELLDKARAVLVGTDVIHDVPITIDLAGDGIFGLHGPSELVAGVASSMIVQAACLHSPEDLTIAVAVGDRRPMASWLKWLPHLRMVTSPLGGSHLATDVAEAENLIGRLLEVAEFRVEENTTNNKVDRRWPWILAIIDGKLEPDPADVARLLDLCPAAGISVVWMADTAAGIPRQAVEVLVADYGASASLVGTIWSTDPQIEDRRIEVEQIRLDIAERVARALAPLRDASTASLASSIPRVAPLLDVLGIGTPTPEWVIGKWNASNAYGLSFPVGMGSDGPLFLDLVEDGPHTLIGGTSGAGKSELMQSIVASLAVHHPPGRLNFLFVDYKGGASSNVFGGLPHTVGYVTNLSAELSLRALTSLQAELNGRMAVMEGKAKDLEEMLELYPDEAPASLVIIVDEFATLVKEVPEFVAGIVDIAQRGRSLGIHLILATQRPSGSVNDNILANTNMRISLRMLDRGESNSVINSPDAADIPVPLKGRAYARLGPRSLVAFQSAFCGAPLTTEELETPVLTARFERTDDSPKGGGGGGGPDVAGTHLDAVLAAVSAASARMELGPPRKPWRDVLPDVVTLSSVLADERSAEAHRLPGRFIAMGMLDSPERQDQSPAVMDLESGGGLLVFGSGGSGKTTVLRTIAVSAAVCAEPGEIEIIGFDFASRGLASLLPLPQVVGVASGDDLEAVTRQLARLDAELQRRRAVLAEVHAENLTAYNAVHAPLSRILVLLDGFAGFTAAFTGGGSSMAMATTMDAWADMFYGLLVEGRQVGIHVVATADRRNAVPSRLHASVANKVILQQADDSSYSEHGVPTTRAKGLQLAPGRGLWQADAIVQIASVSHDPVGKSQSETIARFAESMVPLSSSRIASEPLPKELRLDALGAHDRTSARLTFPLGLQDLGNAVVEIDLTWSNFLVAGAPRSGRSTTLSICAAGLQAEHEVWAIGPKASAFDRSLADHEAFGRAEVVSEVLECLVARLESGDTSSQPVLLLDDLDTFDETSLNPLWEKLTKFDDLRMVASMETRSLVGYTTSPLLTALRRARRLLVLQPDDASEIMQATGVKAPLRPGQQMVPGRGVLVVDRAPSMVQVAMP